MRIKWRSVICAALSWLLIAAMFIPYIGMAKAAAVTEESQPIETQEEASVPTEAPEQTSAENPNGEINELLPPDPMTVKFLEAVMGLNGGDQAMRLASTRAAKTCDRIEIVDVSGAPIAGAPASIPMGWISDVAAWDFPDGGHYELQSAKVGDHNCVFVGEYNGQVYYSEDGSIAMKLEDGEKIRLVYRRYYWVTFAENTPEWGVVSNASGELPNNTPVKVYADQCPMEFTVTAGSVVGSERYKISSVEPSAAVTRIGGDEYSGTYSVNPTEDTTVQVNYDNTGVYRVTVNSSSIGADGSVIDGLYSISPATIPANEDCYSSFTITLKTKKGVRLTSLNLNGRVFFSSNGEFPTDDGDSNTVTGWDGTIYSVQIRVDKGSGDIGYTYTINVTPQRQYNKYLPVDLNFDVTYEKADEAINVLHIYTNGQRSDEGAEVAYWRPVEEPYALIGTKYNGDGALESATDGTTYSLDPTYGVDNFNRVVLIFAKAKPGYRISVDASNGGKNGGNCTANAGNIDELKTLDSGTWAKFKNFQAIQENAYAAAKAAGYTHFIAMVGPVNRLHDSEIAYSNVRAYKDEFYVEYDKGNLPAGVESKNIPQNEEHYSYGPYDWGDSFVVGEGLPQPECEGYEFAGWKVAGTELIYQQNAVLKLEGSEIAEAKQTVLYKGYAAVTNPSYSQDGIRLVAQWTKKPDAQEREVTVKHYLKKADGTEELKLTETQIVLFYGDETEKTITAIPKTFDGYIFDTQDNRNVVEATVRKDGTDSIELVLYYKPLETDKVRIAYKLEDGTFLWKSFERGDPKEYSIGDVHTVFSVQDLYDMNIYPNFPYGWSIIGWQIENDPNKKTYTPGERLPIDDVTVDYAIRYEENGEVYYQIELVPVRNKYAFIAYTHDQEGKTEDPTDYIWRSLTDYDAIEDRFYIGETHTVIDQVPSGTGNFLGWRLKNDPSGKIYNAGDPFELTEDNLKLAVEYTYDEATYGEWEMGTGIINPNIFQYEFVPVWEANVGTLELTKKTVGAPAEDANRPFAFTLTATPPTGQAGESLAGKTFPVEWASGSGAESITFDGNGKATITLKANDGVKINDLPVGWTIGISERTYYNYSASYTGEYLSNDGAKESIAAPNSAVIREDTTCSVTCTNTYAPPTGVALPEGVWLGLLVIASIMGGLLMLTRRRKVK